MNRKKCIFLIVVSFIIVVSVNIQAVEAVTATPPYDDANCAAYGRGYSSYNVNYGVDYAKACGNGGYSSYAWAWVGEMFTCPDWYTYRISTSSRLTVYLEAFNEPGDYPYAYVRVNIHVWRRIWFVYSLVKSVEIHDTTITYLDDTSVQYTNLVVTGSMDVELLKACQYVIGVEIYVGAYDTGRVQKTSSSFTYAELKVDRIDYNVIS
jgi:hypothetical protein